MSYTVIYSKKAIDELFEGWEWYEQKQNGLGDEFENEIYKKISFVLDNLTLYPATNGYKQAQADRFPYLIVFKEIKQTILIVSIFHTSRHPRQKL